MKKILFSLLLFLFAFAFSPYLLADTGTTNYDLTFIENYGYDLANGGTFESMPGYSCTGKTKLINGSLKINTINAQYILFWNSGSMFLGYDIINSNGGLIYLNSYIGDGVYNQSFNMPYNVYTFALMCYNLSEDAQTGFGYSYSDTFENPSYLNYTDSVIGGSSPTGTLADLGSYSTLYNDDVLNVSLQDAFNNPTYLDTLTEYNGMTLEDIFYKGDGDYNPQDTQFLTNPDFTDNINGYTQESTGTISYDTGKLKMVKNAGNMSAYFSFQTDFIEDHIYYIGLRAQRADTKTSSIYVDDVGGDIYSYVVSSGALTDTNMNDYYNTYQAISDDVVLRIGATYSAFYSNDNTAETYYDCFRVHDLTAIFGSGNEPSADMFHEYLAEDSYNTFRTIQNIGYSGDDLDDAQTTFTARSIPVLTLTNLIQNGQFDANTTGFTANNGTLSWDNGSALITGNGLTNIYYLTVIKSLGTQRYYVKVGFKFSNNLPSNFKTQFSGTVLSSIVTKDYNLNQWYYDSGCYDSAAQGSINFLQGFSSNALQTTGLTNYDDISLFLSGSYTKTQIDNVLINFGYLPYNITYYLPDMGASGTGEREFGASESGVYGGYSYVAKGVGIGTGLQIYDFETMWQNGFFNTLEMTGTPFSVFQEWRTVYGDEDNNSDVDTIIGINPSLLPLSVQTDFTTDHSARDYYISLYQDAVNEVERWEWYSAYGVTAENYAYYHQLFLDANDPIIRWEWWKDDGITAQNYDYYINFSVPHTLHADAINEVDRWEWYKEFGITSSNYSSMLSQYNLLLPISSIPFSAFNDSVLYWEYTFSTEPNPTISESIINFLTNINPFWVIVFAFGVMSIVAVILIFTHAPFISYIIFETLLFLLFSIVGFFASWFIIIFVALMYIAIIILAKRKIGGV